MSNITKEEQKKIVANHIAKLLYVKGYSQVQLGKMIEVSHTTIQNYLNEVNLPSPSKIRRLARIAGVTPEEFMTDGGFNV